jgi:hypothetical protein
MSDAESDKDDSGPAARNHQNAETVEAAQNNFSKWNATAELGGCFSMKKCEDGFLRIECNICHVRAHAL